MNRTTSMNEILAPFEHKVEDFVCLEITVYRDRMNDGWYEESREKVIIPKSFEDKVEYATVDFTMTGIKFYDKSQQELFSTVGEGYADLVQPTAFFVEHFTSETVR